VAVAGCCLQRPEALSVNAAVGWFWIEPVTSTVSRLFRSCPDLLVFEIPQVRAVRWFLLAPVRDGSGTMRAPAAPCSGREQREQREHEPGEHGLYLRFFWAWVDVRSRARSAVVRGAGSGPSESDRGTRPSAALARSRTAVIFGRIKADDG
jgi:hypothetical protein